MIMQIRVKKRGENGLRFSRLAAHHSPLVRSRDVRSIALKTLGKEIDCSQSRYILIIFIIKLCLIYKVMTS